MRVLATQVFVVVLISSCSLLSCPILSCSVLLCHDLLCSDAVCSVSVCSQGCMQKEEGKAHPLQSVLSLNLFLFCLSLFCPVLSYSALFWLDLSYSVLFWPDLLRSATVCSQGCMQKEEGKVHPPQPVLSVSLLFCSSLFCPVPSYSDLICSVLSLSVLSQFVLRAACRKKKEMCTHLSLYCRLISSCSVFCCCSTSSFWYITAAR